MRNGRNVLVSFAVLALLAAGAVTELATAPPARAATRLGVSASAASYAAAHGYHVGIAIYDTRTGAVHGTGYYRSTFASESVVKVFIATRLLIQGAMTGTTEKMAYKMITQSDDNMASALYGRVGGDSLINWVKSYFHQPNLGSPPRRAGWWGNTHITPLGLVELYAKLRANKRVAPWLLNAMHHATKYGSDGTYQFFGLASASSGAAIKQGWGADYDDWFHSADFNTTGFVNGDRYAIAILARGPISTYGSKISTLLTNTARILLPGGAFPDPPPAISARSRRTGPTSGGTSMTIHGVNFTHVTAVYFGTVRSTRFTVSSPSTVQATSPPHAAGTVNVRVDTNHGMSSMVAGDLFTYVAPPTIRGVTPGEAPAAGGATVTVTGTNFQYVGQVLFGSVPGTALHVLSATTLTVVAPAQAAGPGGLRVVAPYGTTPVVAVDRVTYVAPPAVSGIAPGTGPAAGGTTVTLTGSGYLDPVTGQPAVTGVSFGGVAGTKVAVTSDTTLTVMSPAAAAPGGVPVTVSTAYGASAPVTFTYTP